jgi:hypothetical protein
MPNAAIPAPSYDSNCVQCRYSRPGATTTHVDHVQLADMDERVNDEGCTPGGWVKSPT